MGNVACIEVKFFGGERAVTYKGLAEFDHDPVVIGNIARELLEFRTFRFNGDGPEDYRRYTLIDADELRRQMARVYYKTTIEIVVLSEDRIPDDMELATIVRECDDGAFVRGDDSCYTVQEINAEDMRRELEDAGADEEFFEGLEQV